MRRTQIQFSTSELRTPATQSSARTINRSRLESADPNPVPNTIGPNGSGVADDKESTPTIWSETENLKWKVPLPGAGVSCPIVVGNRVFVTCYSGYGLNQDEPGDIKNLVRHLVCVDRITGKTLWQKSLPSSVPEDPFSGMGVPQHGYASHTPTSDGKNVYVFFGKSGVLAFDLEGNQLWEKSVGKGSDDRRWGSSSSPIVHEDVLIVPAGAEGRALIGLNKNTGEEFGGRIPKS